MEAESGPREAAVSLCQTPSTRNQKSYTTALAILKKHFKGLDQPLLTENNQGMKYPGLSSPLQGPSIHTVGVPQR